MRVTTAFNRILDLPGASVATVSFTDDGLVLGLRHRRRRPVCPCGRRGRGCYDRSWRRWRHLDFGVCKVFLEAEARNRIRAAVERTVPFGLYTQSIVIVWYHLAGHHPSVVRDRRHRAPWYTTKRYPSYLDMIVKLRRVLIAAQYQPEAPGQPTHEEIRAVHLAWGRQPRNRETREVHTTVNFRSGVRLLGFVWVILSRVEGFLVGAAKDAGGRRVS